MPEKSTLYVRRGTQLGDLARTLEQAGTAVLPADQLFQETDHSGPAVLCVDAELAKRYAEIAGLPQHITIIASDEEAETALGDGAELSSARSRNDTDKLRVLRAALELSACRHAAVEAKEQLERHRQEVAELNRLGMALMTEHDHETLLRQVVTQVMRLTHSDGGALFLIEKTAAGTTQLRFKVVACDSRPDLPGLVDMTFPVDQTSLAGYVALTRTPLILHDAHNLPLGVPYRVNTFVQEEYGYWRKPIFTMPLIDHEHEVVAVMQLVNRKRDPARILKTREDVEQHTIPYTDHDVQLALSIAGQAAVSIENAQLYQEIQHLLECFVKAAVTAIDQRDPATSGHSVRVATLVTDLAKALERSGRGPYRGLSFSPAQMRELRYAALLHDFGKVGVREEVLTKARKLSPAMWARVETRFDLIRCTMHLDYERKRTAAQQDPIARTALEKQFAEEQAQLDRYWAIITAANQPTVLPQEAARALAEIAAREFERADGRVEPYLTAEELHFLSIPQGSLDERERLEVQSHATQTFDFLTQIPWTNEMKDIASHASAHHEKLNGTGYPHHLMAEDIPLQARLIAIADVFDALTSGDRPYKPAISADAALAILRQEADEGLLDGDIVDVLAESQVYRRVLEEDWRAL